MPIPAPTAVLPRFIRMEMKKPRQAKRRFRRKP
jgi:hypothetical protein